MFYVVSVSYWSTGSQRTAPEIPESSAFEPLIAFRKL